MKVKQIRACVKPSNANMFWFGRMNVILMWSILIVGVLVCAIAIGVGQYVSAVIACIGFCLAAFWVWLYVHIRDKKVLKILQEQEKKQVEIATNFNKYAQTYTSFSGADIRIFITDKAKDDKKKKSRLCINTQGLSFRYLFEPSKASGTPPKIAGSMIMSLHDGKLMSDMMKTGHDFKDSLITLSASNEYGQTSIFELVGVKFVDLSMGISIDALINTYTITFYANDLHIVYDHEKAKNINSKLLDNESKTKKANNEENKVFSEKAKSGD